MCIRDRYQRRVRGSIRCTMSRGFYPLPRSLERSPERFGALLRDPRMEDPSPFGHREEADLELRRLQAEIAAGCVSEGSMLGVHLRSRQRASCLEQQLQAAENLRPNPAGLAPMAQEWQQPMAHQGWHGASPRVSGDARRRIMHLPNRPNPKI
eukprot:TRINITY_DN22035_c0_g1_i2.p1 TRINITY_DN22035_c0_g1~~TRINITY_DN22035_c0_g1_i2.p1  ORF type:complete len:153 (+),score=24.79 TRINITY_DN22035_c0_g1_i2:181-639(+)